MQSQKAKFENCSTHPLHERISKKKTLATINYNLIMSASGIGKQDSNGYYSATQQCIANERCENKACM